MHFYQKIKSGSMKIIPKAETNTEPKSGVLGQSPIVVIHYHSRVYSANIHHHWISIWSSDFVRPSYTSLLIGIACSVLFPLSI